MTEIGPNLMYAIIAIAVASVLVTFLWSVTK